MCEYVYTMFYINFAVTLHYLYNTFAICIGNVEISMLKALGLLSMLKAVGTDIEALEAAARANSHQIVSGQVPGNQPIRGGRRRGPLPPHVKDHFDAAIKENPIFLHNVEEFSTVCFHCVFTVCL